MPTAGAYDTIILTQPKDQDTLHNSGGELSIIIDTPLRKNDKWRILLDGKETGELQTTPQFTLQNIERGEHTLQIQAVDTNNKTVASSDILTLYIHQTISPPS